MESLLQKTPHSHVEWSAAGCPGMGMQCGGSGEGREGGGVEEDGRGKPWGGFEVSLPQPRQSSHPHPALARALSAPDSLIPSLSTGVQSPLPVASVLLSPGEVPAVSGSHPPSCRLSAEVTDGVLLSPSLSASRSRAAQSP